MDGHVNIMIRVRYRRELSDGHVNIMIRVRYRRELRDSLL